MCTYARVYLPAHTYAFAGKLHKNVRFSEFGSHVLFYLFLYNFQFIFIIKSNPIYCIVEKQFFIFVSGKKNTSPIILEKNTTKPQNALHIYTYIPYYMYPIECTFRCVFCVVYCDCAHKYICIYSLTFFLELVQCYIHAFDISISG